jgi:hypothetical protein
MRCAAPQLQSVIALDGRDAQALSVAALLRR